MRRAAAALALLVLALGGRAEGRMLTGFENGLPGELEGSSAGPLEPECSARDLFSPADRPPAGRAVEGLPGLAPVQGGRALLLSTAPLEGGADDLRQSRWRFVFDVEQDSLLSFALAFSRADDGRLDDWFVVTLDGEPVACSRAGTYLLDEGRTGWRLAGGDGSLRLEPGTHVIEAAVGDGLDAAGRSNLLLDAFELRPLHQAGTLPPPTPCRPAPPEDVGEIPSLCTLPPLTDCGAGISCTSPRRVWTFDDNRFCPNGSAGRDADGDGLVDCLECRRPEDVGDPNPPGGCFTCTDATDRFFEMYVVADCGREMHLPLNDVESGCVSIFDQDRNPIEIEVDNGAGFFQRGEEVCWFAEDCDGNSANDPGGPGDTRTMDVRFTADPALCGVFIARFRSWAGCIWDLFANCDGTNTEQFLIFDDLCEAEAAYDPLPELTLDNLVTEPGPDCTVDYCVDVENIGCRLATPHEIRVFNEAGENRHPIGTLQPGDRAQVCGTLPVDDAGLDPQVTRVVAEADAGDEILECTEDPTASSCNAATGGDIVSRVEQVGCNTAPTCDAGGPYSAECGAGASPGLTEIPLDGRGSSDPEGRPLAYSWTTDCPGGEFDDPSSPTPVLLLPGSECPTTCRVSLTVTDPDGLQDSCSDPVSVDDTVAPAISCPEDVDAECGDEGVPTREEWLAQASASDACDPDPTVQRIIRFQSSPCPDSRREVWDFFAVDACGNESEVCQRTWSVMDTLPPVLDLPADRVVECPDDPDADAAAWASQATAVDDCAGPVLVERDLLSVEPGCGGTELRTYRFTATDRCGNTAEGTRTWRSVDTRAPELQGVPADTRVSCDAVPAPARVVASDECDPNPAVEPAETRLPGPCPDSYTLVRTWTARDGCGNESVEEQRIEVFDADPPTVEGVPADTTAACGSVPTPASVSVVDDCDPDPLVEFSEQRADGSCPDRYTLTRTWTARDRCGNETVESQVIRVDDATAPVLQGVPADTQAFCDAIPPVPLVSATDDCDPDPEVAFAETREPGPCPQAPILLRTWTATDRCGNEVTATQRIEILDPFPPQLQGLPADETAQCGEVPPPPPVTVIDSCDPAPVVDFSETRSPGDCPDRFTLTRTWTARDACGNESSASRTVTVDDRRPPVLQGVPADERVSCDAVPPPVSPTASDDCDPDPAIAFDETRADGACPDEYTLTRTWTATDRCGNESEAVQVVTVRDDAPPVLRGVPADETVSCDAVPPPVSPTASDDCDPDPAIALDETRADGACPDEYTLTRTWTATDRCGNESKAVQVITVRDDAPPVLRGVPADLTVQCDAVPPPASPTASDDCDPDPAIAFDETRTDGDCPFRYTLTRTWTATDRCGNASEQVQVVTVQDTIPPELTAPADLTVECPAPASGPGSEEEWRSRASAVDDCGTPEVLSAELSRTPLCGATYEAVFEFWAVDECGNESERVQRTYRVVDTTPPVLTAPDDLVVECPAPEDGPESEEAWRGSASATDSCGGAQVLSELVERIPGCGNTYTDVWDFWAVDECGNESARVRRRYEVVDTTPPEFTAGEPLFEESLWPPQHGYVVFETGEMASATDACGEVTIAVTGCASSQPEEVHQGPTDDGGNGDGRFFEDCVWAEDGTEFAARAERLGGCGPHSYRLYSVEITATDECGNSASAAGLLRVEHDRRGKQDVRRGRKLGPNDPPPWPHVHETVYGEGCGETTRPSRR